MAGSADELAKLLELEQLEVDLFRGTQARTERQRVFGGQVAAQAVVAATTAWAATCPPKTRCRSVCACAPR